MSFNGNGTFIPPAGQPVATGTVIQSSTFNVLVTDIGNTFNNVLPRDGQASMSGQLKLIDGTSAVPGIAFNSEASTGIFRPSAGVMALTVSGVEALRVNNSGRVLVGTITDDGTSKLQVNGSTKITGAVSVTGSVTATSFTGPLTGTVTGAATNISGVAAIVNGGTGATTAVGALLNLGAAPSDSPSFTGMVSGVTGAMVGLGNVNNTSDVNKPVSTAQAAAIAGAKGSLTLLATLTPTAAANIDLLSIMSTVYDNYLITGNGLLPATDTTLRARFANGGAVDAGSNYIVVTSASTNTQSYFDLNLTTLPAAGTGCNFAITLQNANGTSPKLAVAQSLDNTALGPPGFYYLLAPTEN